MARLRAACAAIRCIAAALIAIPGFAVSLTLPEAQRIAVERSRQLIAQDAAITASREMAVAAAQLPDPVATLGINNLPVTGPDAWSVTRDFMTMRSVGVMQEITRAEKREARSERFEREAEKAVAQRSARAADIQRETALAWLERYYAEAQLAVVHEQIGAANLEVDAADTAYRNGRGPLSDVLAARGAVAMLDDRRSELNRKLAAAKIALARWIGDDAEAPLTGEPDIDAIRIGQPGLDEQLAQHPQIAVLAKQEAVAAAEVKVAQANKKPDWSVQLMYSQRGPAYSNMISVGVSVPLQWDRSNRQDREIAAKLAMLEQAKEEREDMLRAQVAEVRAMIVEWENDRERRARYAKEVVPLALQRTEATLIAYRSAKATLGDVVVARRNETDVRMQALQIERETALVWAQLNFLIPAAPDRGAMATEGGRRQ